MMISDNLERAYNLLQSLTIISTKGNVDALSAALLLIQDSYFMAKEAEKDAGTKADPK